MPAPKITDSRPPVGEADLVAVERRMGIPIPLQYRSWLLNYNGGRPDPARFRYKDESGAYTDGRLRTFFGIHDFPHGNLEADTLLLRQIEPRLPGQLMPVAEDAFGNRICISAGGDDEGKVYFWDHEEEEDEPTYANCHLLADTFEEFLNLLH